MTESTEHAGTGPDWQAWRTQRRLDRALARRAAEPLKTPAFDQVCAIAKSVVPPDRDTTEWRERIIERLLALGYDYRDPRDLIHRAMDAVERQLGTTSPPPPPADDTVPVDPPVLSRQDAAALLREVRARCAPPPSHIRPPSPRKNPLSVPEIPCPHCGARTTEPEHKPACRVVQRAIDPAERAGVHP